MDFSAYWKEISVVVTGLFAVLGLLWEAKDKASGRITNWGRVFLVLTILSIVGGLIAQFEENKNVDAKNKKEQQDMLSLLTKTEATIQYLSRVMQPIEKPSVSLFLSVDCLAKVYQTYCEDARKRGEALALKIHPNTTVEASFPIEPDWSLWPQGLPFLIIRINVFKTEGSYNDYLRSECLSCDSAGDLAINLFATKENISVFYDTKTMALEFIVNRDDIKPKVHNANVASVPDLLGSTVAIWGSLDHLRPAVMFIDTPRGQQMTVDNFESKTVHNGPPGSPEDSPWVEIFQGLVGAGPGYHQPSP
jgi:hypothetical protein